MARDADRGHIGPEVRTARLLAATAALSLLAGVALADPLGDAKAGMDALNKGDNDAAIRLFSQALNSGGLAPSDRELAYVKRAQAYAAEKNTASAQADLDAAAKLDPDDQEIATLRASTMAEQNGPSIGEAINFIRQHVADPEPIAYTLQFHDTSSDSDRTLAISRTVADFDADENSCGIYFHSRTTINDSSAIEKDINFHLGGTGTVTLLPVEQTVTRDNAHFANVSAQPSIYVDDFEDEDGHRIDLYFTSENIATRVAQALVYASDKCPKHSGSHF